MLPPHPVQRLWPVLAAVWLLAGCAESGPASAPAVLAPAGLATELIQPQRVPLEHPVDGRVEAVDQAVLSAETAGRVEAILHDVGDEIAAGAVLLRLRSTEQRAALAAAQAARSEAAAREAEAQARFARINDMYERQVVARAQFEQAQAGRDAAVARLAAAQAALESARENLAYTEVRAPYAGILGERLVQVGEAVAPGQPLLRGYAGERLRVVCDLPQELAAALRRSGRAAIYVADRRIEAAGITVFPEADAATSTVRARLELPAGTAGVHPGLFVRAGIVTGEAQRVLVPASALIARSEVSTAYVVDAQGRLGLRQLRRGNSLGEQVEILAGLAAGERLVLDPLAALEAIEAAGAQAGTR